MSDFENSAEKVLGALGGTGREEEKILQRQKVSLEVDGIDPEKQKEIDKSLKETSRLGDEIGERFAALQTTTAASFEAISTSLSGFAFLSQKLDVPISQLKAIDFAFGQIGAKSGQVLANLEQFHNKLRAEPQQHEHLKSRLGKWGYSDAGTDEDRYLSVLKALAKEQQSGDIGRQTGRAFAESIGIDQNLIDRLIANPEVFDKAFAKEAEQTKALDEMGPAAIQLTQSINGLWEALNNVATKWASQHFTSIKEILESLTKWIEANGDSLTHDLDEVMGQVARAAGDMKALFVPFLEGAKKSFLAIAHVVDPTVKSLDAIRYALDTVVTLFFGSVLIRMLLFLNSLSLGGVGWTLRTILAGLGLLGEAGLLGFGAAALTGGLAVRGLTKDEDIEGEGYGAHLKSGKSELGKDFDKLRDWWGGGGAKAATPPPGEQLPGGGGLGGRGAVSPGSPTAPHPSYYSGTLQLGDETFHYGTGIPTPRGWNRGSSAYGDHPLIGGFDQSARGGKGGFRLADQNDPNVPGGPRRGVEIHEGRTDDLDHLYTAGCFAIAASEWPRFKQKLQNYLRVNPGAILRIGPDGRAKIIAKSGAPPAPYGVVSETAKGAGSAPTPKTIQNPLPTVNPSGFHDAIRKLQHESSIRVPPQSMNISSTRNYKNIVTVVAQNPHEAALAVGARMGELHRESEARLIQPASKHTRHSAVPPEIKRAMSDFQRRNPAYESHDALRALAAPPAHKGREALMARGREHGPYDDTGTHKGWKRFEGGPQAEAISPEEYRREQNVEDTITERALRAPGHLDKWLAERGV